MRQAPSRRCTSSPSTANRKAVAKNSGARNTRSFADSGLDQRERSAAISELHRRAAGSRQASAAGPLAPVETPQGTNSAKPMQA